MSDPVDVVAVAAHPDDAEVGCGGTLLLAAEGGWRTAVVDLTAGEMATRGDPVQRAAERDRATALLGLASRHAAGFPDTAVGADPQHRLGLAGIVRALRPQVVLAPSPDDRHPDHAAAGRLTREACFLAGVARRGEGSPHRPRYLLHYMIHTPFEPSLVIDVSAVWEARMAAVAAYASQFTPDREEGETELADASFLETVEARATFYGAMIGVARGEPLRCVGPLGLTGLSALFPPDGGGRPRYRIYP